MAVFLFVTVLIHSFSGCTPKNADSTQQNEMPAYGVFIGVNPDQIDSFYGYDIIVIDAAYYDKTDIDTLHQKEITVYSYLNIGSIESFRDYFVDYQHLILGEYENWQGEYWMDISDESWQEHINEAAGLLIEKGVDGFFVDNADIYYQYHTAYIFQGMVSVLNKLGQYRKDIFLNGGDVFVTQAIIEADSPAVYITGVNQECVFTDIDFEKEQLVRQTAENTVYYQQYLEQCRANGLTVYLLEYSDIGAEPSEIDEYCNAHQFNYYISASIDLQ